MKAKQVIFIAIGMVFLTILLSSCGSNHPGNDEVIAILNQEISRSEAPHFYKDIKMEISDWKKEGDDRIAKVKTTAVSTRFDSMPVGEGVERLFYPGHIEVGRSYSKVALVTFKKSNKGWTLKSVQ